MLFIFYLLAILGAVVISAIALFCVIYAIAWLYEIIRKRLSENKKFI